MKRVRRWGGTVILSDGDAVFQPRKVERSGLWKAFGGHVLIYVHKENTLADVEKHLSCQHYVMVDDKLRILEAIKKHLERPRDHRLCQARSLRPTTRGNLDRYPPADISIGRIGDLLDINAQPS